jgi:hypothetical protein
MQQVWVPLPIEFLRQSLSKQLPVVSKLLKAINNLNTQTSSE